jgi:hypothetical protein
VESFNESSVHILDCFQCLGIDLLCSVLCYFTLILDIFIILFVFNLSVMDSS